MASGGKYIYSRAALEYNFEVFVLYLSISISVTLFFYFTAIQRQILYLLLRYIYLTPLLTSYFTDSD